MKKLRALFETRPRLILLLGAGVLAVIIIVFFVYQYTHQVIPLTAADQQDIKRVTLTAFGAVNELVVTPHAKDNPTGPINPADIQAARAHARAVFNSIYAPDCTVCQNVEKSVDMTILGQQNGHYRALDGGVSNIQRHVIQPSFDSVTVTLKATTWSKVSFGGETESPKVTVTMIYTLKKFGDQWLIVNQVQQGMGA